MAHSCLYPVNPLVKCLPIERTPQKETLTSTTGAWMRMGQERRNSARVTKFVSSAFFWSSGTCHRARHGNAIQCSCSNIHRTDLQTDIVQIFASQSMICAVPLNISIQTKQSRPIKGDTRTHQIRLTAWSACVRVFPAFSCWGAAWPLGI